MGDVNFFLILAFVVFSVITLGGAIGVVTTRNLFRGTIWLMVSLFGVAGYYVLLEAPFLAAVQILVYIGAIAILFTFAVMLTRSLTALTDRYTRPVANLVGAVLMFALLMLGIVLPVWYGWEPDPSILTARVQDTRDLGIALVDKEGFVLPFELVSLLLTAAMIGAIVIAREVEEDEKGKRG
ncbi:MAG: NADH-quinone oxidoreductase subunit J family protein [Anaerolineae bacterium]